MNSMTGFGRAEAKSKFGQFTIEISSVNSRFLEAAVRLPRPLTSLEPQVRKLLTASAARGKVSLFVNLAEPETQAGDVTINRELVKSYYRDLKKLKKELRLSGEITVADILQLPEITRQERTELDLEAAWSVIKKGLQKALKMMQAMRAREGKAMASDMRQRLKNVAGLISEIEKATSGAVEKYAHKLSDRIEDLLANQNHDRTRLEQEIAFFAERTDIAEECTRLMSHVDQFRAALKIPNAIGRRLNFILQEMNREVNTIGSKGSDFDISSKVISLKEEIEKLREQVQNVE